MLLLDLIFSLLLVCSLWAMAFYSDRSSICSFDYYDNSASLGPDLGSDRFYPHTDPVVMAD